MLLILCHCLGIVPIKCVQPIQTTSTMLLQGERMDARVGGGADWSRMLPVASLNFVKMAVIAVLIPVLDRFVFPLLDDCDRKPTLLQRIGRLSVPMHSYRQRMRVDLSLDLSPRLPWREIDGHYCPPLIHLHSPPPAGTV